MAPRPRDIPLEPQFREGLAQVHRTRTAGVLILAPQGLLEPDDLDDLEQLIGDAEEPVIIDMGDCMLGRSDLLVRLDPARWGRPSDQVCLVCRRYSARLLLSRTGVAHRIAVFGGLEDALRARTRTHPDGRSGWAR